MKPLSRYRKLDRLWVHYLEWPGTEPPVLMVHGSSFNASTWAPIAERLSPARVLAVDVRGHGDSQGDLGLDYRDWRAYGQDIAELAAELDLRRVTIVGHSAGGAWSVYAASRILDRVAGMALLDPVFFAPADPGGGPGGGSTAGMVERALRRRSRWESWDEAADYFRRRAPFTGFDPNAFDLFVRTALRPTEGGAVELKCSTAVEAAMYAGQDANDVWPLLPLLRFPVLLVEAGETNILTPERAAEVARRLPQGRRTHVPLTGHFLPFEQPEAVATVIRALIAGLCTEESVREVTQRA